MSERAAERATERATKTLGRDRRRLKSEAAVPEVESATSIDVGDGKTTIVAAAEATCPASRSEAALVAGAWAGAAELPRRSLVATVCGRLPEAMVWILAMRQRIARSMGVPSVVVVVVVVVALASASARAMASAMKVTETVDDAEAAVRAYGRHSRVERVAPFLRPRRRGDRVATAVS